MTYVSYTQLRQNLAKYMDEISKSRAPLHVTRQNARAVVMLDEDEFNGLMETLHLLRSPKNARRLRRSIGRANRGQFREHKL